jgi:CDP-diacylglycerol---glycerol-3-phosphate 3-phosphatidyltransferase
MRGLTTTAGNVGVQFGIHPDTVTLIGTGIVLIAALFAANGAFFASGATLILGTPLDVLDGAIARARGKPTRFGALLDSSLDRYADGFMYAGIAYYYASLGDLPVVALALVGMIGGFATPYVRARAEGLDLPSIKQGFFDRLVRTVILIGALLSGLIVPGLVILAVGNHITAIQRILIARRLSYEFDAAEAEQSHS